MKDTNRTPNRLSRRHFLGQALAGAAVSPALSSWQVLAAETTSPPTAPPEFTRKIKLGLIGCGGRGSWIGQLFRNHGGYEIYALADYFAATADQAGETLGTAKARRFSGLSGYRRVLESGVEAVALETPPYFFPEHARAAVAAGIHVYMAKPIAVDVPGVLVIEAAAQKATAQQRCFRVDYQIPTDPHNQRVAQMIRDGELGRIALYTSRYWAAQWSDPPLGDTIENRLRSLIWCNDITLGGSHHVNACIHSIDAVIWLAGKRPISAVGCSRIARDNPHGDSHDIISVTYEFDDGVLWNHSGKHLNNQHDFDSSALVHGTKGFAQVTYGGKASLNSFDNSYAGEVANLYAAGAERNIAGFYQDILEGHFENTTARRAVDGTLTAILSREATRRRTRLTMEELLRENHRLELNLRGLKST